jgi:hypothetical protein
MLSCRTTVVIRYFSLISPLVVFNGSNPDHGSSSKGVVPTEMLPILRRFCHRPRQSFDSDDIAMVSVTIRDVTGSIPPPPMHIMSDGVAELGRS